MKIGARIRVKKTPWRGVVTDMVNGVCLVFFDHKLTPSIYHKSDLEEEDEDRE